MTCSFAINSHHRTIFPSAPSKRPGTPSPAPASICLSYQCRLPVEDCDSITAVSHSDSCITSMTLTGPLDYSVPRISAPFLPQIRQTRKRTLWVLLILVPSCLALTICSLVAGTSSPTPLPKLSLGTIINSIHLQVAKAASLAPLASPSALNTRVERRSKLDSKRRGPRTTPVLSSKQCTPTESQSWHIHKAYNTLAPSTPTKLKAASDPPRKVRQPQSGT